MLEGTVIVNVILPSQDSGRSANNNPEERVHTATSTTPINGPLQAIQNLDGNVGDIIILNSQNELLYRKHRALYLLAFVYDVGSGKWGATRTT